ncbi:MBL fold metallo-hydrolase [Gracilimonas sp.]|uniref:MBL fold metallo-hydrolase n=1 Tax=Gracilimonas sp. TaxID=1974203 RepID=UPI0032EF9D6C
MRIKVWYIGVATILIEIGSIKIITDPNLDKPGNLYHHGFLAFSKKNSIPRFEDQLKHIDLALISHAHHKDNLDRTGLKLLNNVNQIITTYHSSIKLKRGIGLDPGESFIYKKRKNELEIIAIEAQHGVFPVHYFAGPVIGFIIRKTNSNNLIYISGDTIYKSEIAKQVNDLGDTKLFIPHLGKAQFKYLSGNLRYTMNETDLKHFITDLSPERIFPVHNEGWTHFNKVQNPVDDDFKNRLIKKNEFETDI